MPNALFERFGPEFISHLCELDAWFRPQVSTLSDARSRIGLDTQEVTLSRHREPVIVNFRALEIPFVLRADRLLILDRDINAYRVAARTRFHGAHSAVMRSNHHGLKLLCVSQEKASE